MTHAEHWEKVYSIEPDEKLSWFQKHPEQSVQLIRGLDPRARGVVDVGGGQSALAGALVTMGIERVVVLDVSPSAVRRGQERMGNASSSVRWLVGDVLDEHAIGDIDVWHDRAVFHFLTDEDERRRYVQRAADALPPGGHAVIATFAPNGPEKCSGLPVHRYEAHELAETFGDSFSLVRSETERHTTPWGASQEFVYVVLERRAQQARRVPSGAPRTDSGK